MTDEPTTIWIPNQNFFPGRNGLKPAYIILHGTAGGTSAVAIANYFASTQGGPNPVASNYIIDQAGTIVQTVLEADGAYANGFISGTPGTAMPDSGNGIRDAWWSPSVNPNLITVSIEHVKSSTDNSDQLTDAQKQASFTLIKHICERNGIPMRPADATGGITGHYSIDAINRTHCPGSYPWSDLWAFLQGGNMGGIPNGWTDDGTTLTAPNGHKVVQGFRQYILTHPWDPLNYPLEEEHVENPLEESNPALGSGSQQIFRWTMLGYTLQQGVFVEWIGQELLTLRQASTEFLALKSQAATLLQSMSQVSAAAAQITAIAKQFEAS